MGGRPLTAKKIILAINPTFDSHNPIKTLSKANKILIGPKEYLSRECFEGLVTNLLYFFAFKKIEKSTVYEQEIWENCILIMVSSPVTTLLHYG